MSKIPQETYHAARKVFNIHHIYIRIGDQLETLLAGCDASLLDPTASLSTDSVFRLALVTSFQFAESLPDPLASEATLRRMDWKYALYLPISYPGISASSLCRFRLNLKQSTKGIDAYAHLLQELAKLGLFSRAAGQYQNPLLSLNIVCKINHVFEMRQALKTTLGVLTSAAPDWVKRNAPPYWFDRYRTEAIGYTITNSLEDEAGLLGEDARLLLEKLNNTEGKSLATINEVTALERLYHGLYSQEGSLLTWQSPDCAVCPFYRLT